MIKKVQIQVHLHLIISILIVVPAALLYGFQPDLLFEVTINSPDQSTIFKAIMGLYLGFSLLWFYGIINIKWWKTATLSNMIFMLGLGFGRLISLLMDGLPSALFVGGTIGELLLGFYALYLLKTEK